MQINFNKPYSYNNFHATFKGDINNPSKTLADSNLTPLQKDVFEKVQPKKADEIKENNFDKNSVEQIYNETYEIVKEQNPYFDELKIPKPKLKIIKQGNNNPACYNTMSNSIELRENLLSDDYYICYLKQKNGGKFPYGVISNSDMDSTVEMINRQKEFCGCETVKLSEEEKELYIKAIIAHELRHCLQHHLAFSTKGCSSEVLNRYLGIADSYLTPMEQIKETYHKIANMQKYEETKREIDEYKEQHSYILNFKPTKYLDENAKLRFSMFDNDKRNWSIKNHFAKAVMTYSSSDKDIYYSSPLEIDAYNYEKEFLMTQYIKQKQKYRQDCILGMMAFSQGKYASGLENLTKNGYCELE